MSVALDPIDNSLPNVDLTRQRASLGEYIAAVGDDAWQGNPLPSLMRSVERAATRETAVAEYDAMGNVTSTSSETLIPAAAPLIPAAEATERAKALGLTFDKDVNEAEYGLLVRERQRQLANETVYRRARNEGGYGVTAAGLSVLTELFVGAADPLNIVASFLPVVPAGGRAAAALTRLGPNAGRVVRGAIEGGAGAAVLEPFVALERGAWDPDHGFGDSVLNVAFGSALGGGLHWFGGKVSDWRRARKPPSPDAPPEAGGAPLNAPPAASSVPQVVPQVMAEAVDRAAPQTRETALRVAVAALAQDRRVDVEAVLRSDPAFVPPRVETATSRLALDAGKVPLVPAGDPVGEYRFFQQGLASLSAMRTAELRGDTWRTPVPRDWQPDDALLQQAMRLRRGLAPDRPLPEPLSLSQFVRARGGIDRASVEAGDARAADLQKARGLLRGKQPKTTIGDQIEYVMRAALDDGFYPDVKARDEELDLNQFLDDLAADAHGVRRTYREGDGDVERWRDQQAYFKATAEWLESEGLDLANMRPRDLAWLMQLDSRRQRIEVLASRVDRLTDAESLELRDRLDAELADAVADELEIAKASLNEAKAGNMVGDGEPLTLADLERINADIERSETADRGYRRSARQVDAAGNAGGADPRADGPQDAGAAGREGPAGREGQEAQGVKRAALGSESAAAVSARKDPMLTAEQYESIGKIVEVQDVFTPAVRGDGTPVMKKALFIDPYGRIVDVSGIGHPAANAKLNRMIGALEDDESALFYSSRSPLVRIDNFYMAETNTFSLGMQAYEAGVTRAQKMVIDAIEREVARMKRRGEKIDYEAEVSDGYGGRTVGAMKDVSIKEDGLARIDVVATARGPDAKGLVANADDAAAQASVVGGESASPADAVEALQRASADPATDLHADVAASDRIKAEAATPEPDPREEAARLEADYAQQLTDADRAALEAVVKPHEDTIKAVEALAQCRVGGDLPMAPKAAPKGGDA